MIKSSMMTRTGLLLHQEPLIQFLLLGSVIFFLSYFLNNNPSSDEFISVPTQELDKFASDYENKYGAPPKQNQIDLFIQSWIEDEVLYREGLNLKLDKHDSLVRERVIKKMKLLLTGPEQVTATDHQLSSFMLSNKHLYNDPAMFSFYMIELTKQPTLATTNSDYSNMILSALNNGGDPAFMGLKMTHYQHKRPGFLNARYGTELVDALSQTPQDSSWKRVSINELSYLLKLTNYKPEQLPELSQIKPRVLKDWRKAQSKLRLQEHLVALQQNYTIE